MALQVGLGARELLASTSNSRNATGPPGQYIRRVPVPSLVPEFVATALERSRIDTTGPLRRTSCSQSSTTSAGFPSEKSPRSTRWFHLECLVREGRNRVRGDLRSSTLTRSHLAIWDRALRVKRNVHKVGTRAATSPPSIRTQPRRRRAELSRASPHRVDPTAPFTVFDDQTQIECFQGAVASCNEPGNHDGLN